MLIGMTTAAVYLRISLDAAGKAEGVERQQKDCAGLVKARKWELLATYTDNDISAAGKRVRPGFIALMEALEAGQVQAVVAQRWDRLSRNRRDDLRLLEACEKHGVLLAFSRGGDLDLSTPMGSMFADMLASQARNEIKIKGDRQRLAQLQRAEKGRPAKGIRPTGYALDGSIIPEEAKLIRRIFDQFTAGGTLKGIAAKLQEDGITTRRGGWWSPSSVSSILQNARYAGRSVYKGQDLGPATWKPIISEAQFAAVQSRLADPRRKTRGESTARKHLGSGLYYCTCGLRIRSSSRVYTCRAFCYYRTRQAIDDYVLAVIRGRLGRPDLREMLAKPADKTRLAELAAERKELDHRIKATQADYDADLIEGTRYKAKTAKLQAEVDAIRGHEAKLVAATGPGAVLAAKDPVAAFDAADLATRQAVIDAVATVTLQPATRARGFDPSSVAIEWR